MIIHIDFNSFFATVEQQANPRLRGKPIGVTGGDRITRTVVGAASVEAKLRGVKTGMRVPEALKLCPDLILVRGDSDKYLEINKKFLNLLKRYTDKMEVFSIDEVFLEIGSGGPVSAQPHSMSSLLVMASDIKNRIRKEVGEWMSCSIGISYNKMVAKLAGSLYKPDGLVGIFDPESAVWVLDRVDLTDICGIGERIKSRLNNLGIFNFSDLRKVPFLNLTASFGGIYGSKLFNFARGIDETAVVPFFEKEEVKSIGHRHTISHDVSDPVEIKQVLLKLCELVARRARAKNLEGKTISFWFRYAFNLAYLQETGSQFYGNGMQTTISHTSDGLDIFKASWKCFMNLWDPSASSGQATVRMVGVSLSNLKPAMPQNLTFLEDMNRREVITRALDKVNDRYGEFTLQRAVLLNSKNIRRMANSFMSDRRFKI